MSRRPALRVRITCYSILYSIMSRYDDVLRIHRGGLPVYPMFSPTMLLESAKTLTLYCVCVVILFILDVRFVDVLAGVTQQEEGYTGVFHLPSAVLVIIFIARRIQPFLSLVDREVEFCLY